MSNEQKGFIVYKDVHAVVDELTDEQAGKLFRGMIKYFTEGKAPKFDGVLKLVFIPIKQQMDRDIEKYQQKCQKNRENIQAYWDKVKSDSNENERIRLNTMATNTNTKTNKNTETKTKTNTTTTTNKNAASKQQSGSGPDNDDFNIWNRLSAEDRDAIYRIYPNSGGFLMDEVYEEVKRTRRNVKDPVTYILGYARNKKWDDNADHFDY